MERDDGILTVTHAGGEVVLGVGDEVTFGRDQGDGPGVDAGAGVPHLALSTSARLHAHAGRIEALDDGWLLVNEGRWLHLRVVPRDGADSTDVTPGRTLRVPWPSVRVEVATGEEVVSVEVDCPLLATEAPASGAVPAGDTVRALDLDRDAGYFRALVALCAPRLRDPSTPEVPTVAEVARTLSALPVEGGRVSTKAVERRLAHVRRRAGVGGDPDGVSAAGLEVRDASRRLVDLALRTGTVTVADLDLLADDGVAAPRP